ncbi:hypothetical protein [Phytohabitans rumicis]|uniref:hypothetical protein n=1 Tax=Phytohabitans rumicis TaxID=1076125 RepID=UPI001566A4D2|nr:hypothetical protein [Phytohabitans rumicis]
MRHSLPTINWVRLPDGSDPDQRHYATQSVQGVLRVAAAVGFPSVGVDTVTAAGFVDGREDELAGHFRTAGVLLRNGA